MLGKRPPGLNVRNGLLLNKLGICLKFSSSRECNDQHRRCHPIAPLAGGRRGRPWRGACWRSLPRRRCWRSAGTASASLGRSGTVRTPADANRTWVFLPLSVSDQVGPAVWTHKKIIKQIVMFPSFSMQNYHRFPFWGLHLRTYHSDSSSTFFLALNLVLDGISIVTSLPNLFPSFFSPLPPNLVTCIPTGSTPRYRGLPVFHRSGHRGESRAAWRVRGSGVQGIAITGVAMQIKLIGVHQENGGQITRRRAFWTLQGFLGFKKGFRILGFHPIRKRRMDEPCGRPVCSLETATTAWTFGPPTGQAGTSALSFCQFLNCGE